MPDPHRTGTTVLLKERVKKIKGSLFNEAVRCLLSYITGRGSGQKAEKRQEKNDSK